MFNINISYLKLWIQKMSYDEKKYLEEHKKTWNTFVSISIKGSIIIAIILIIMAIFLTN